MTELFRVSYSHHDKETGKPWSSVSMKLPREQIGKSLQEAIGWMRAGNTMVISISPAIEEMVERQTCDLLGVE